MQHVEDRLFACVEGLVALALLKADHHIVLRGHIVRVADALNSAVFQAGLFQPLANVIYGWLAGKTDINESAAAEVDPIAHAVISKDRNPANRQKDQGERDEILCLPHPINVHTMEEFHAESYPPAFDTAAPSIVPMRRISP